MVPVWVWGEGRAEWRVQGCWRQRGRGVLWDHAPPPSTTADPRQERRRLLPLLPGGGGKAPTAISAASAPIPRKLLPPPTGRQHRVQQPLRLRLPPGLQSALQVHMRIRTLLPRLPAALRHNVEVEAHLLVVVSVMRLEATWRALITLPLLRAKAQRAHTATAAALTRRWWVASTGMTDLRRCGRKKPLLPPPPADACDCDDRPPSPPVDGEGDVSPLQPYAPPSATASGAGAASAAAAGPSASSLLALSGRC